MLWNLTGGVDGGVHATDVTNASRTMFMDLETLSARRHPRRVRRAALDDAGDPELLGGLRQVESSSLLREVPVAGILGDQQAATFGQAAFDAGESKNTYGTGNFLIFNTGRRSCTPRTGC